ncbi:hypothetical protein GE061_012623 [Apolygus lucorum]|uniref:Uncharacterized protein n=1 Tax=Apolygus lucorum TaxID=248454 RepID=A0A6A4J0I2_APOLU|nr:hypothetical protein GE061_012623 [Apolygus lucorum]
MKIVLLVISLIGLIPLVYLREGCDYAELSELCPCKAEETISRVFCHDEPVILDCLETQYISKIKEARFGRTHDYYCGNVDHPEDSNKTLTDCTEYSNVKNLIISKCRFKESCQVESRLFTSTGCPGDGSKYIKVTYICYEKEPYLGSKWNYNVSRGCQDEELKLDCSSNKERPIITVHSAVYGRTDPGECYDAKKNTNSLTCRAENSTSEVEKRCDEVSTCTINATKSIFGDPCPDVSKYLEVKEATKFLKELRLYAVDCFDKEKDKLENKSGRKVRGDGNFDSLALELNATRQRAVSVISALETELEFYKDSSVAAAFILVIYQDPGKEGWPQSLHKI